MNTHLGVLTRDPFRHPAGKVAYCTISTPEADFELVVFRKYNRAYQALLSLEKGDIVEVRGNRHDDEYNGKVSKQLIAVELAKDKLEDLEPTSTEFDLENLPDAI